MLNSGLNVIYLELSAFEGIEGTLRFDPLDAPGSISLYSLDVRLRNH